MANCGSCKKFNGSNKPCGQTYFVGDREKKYTPMNEKVGPCMEGYVAKSEKNCGSCEKFGADKRCKDAGISVEANWGYACSEHQLKLNPTIVKHSDGVGFIKIAVQPEKEPSNMSNAIIRLADSQFSKEVEDFGGLSIDLKDALEELQTKQKKEAAAAAAQEVMKLLNGASSAIENYVGDIQAARRAETRAKAGIAEVAKAKAYGLATNNFVPLGVLTGAIFAHHVENKELLKIDESKLPEGWDKKPEAK